MMAWPFAALVLVVALTAACFQVLGRLAYGYKLRANRIDFVLFGVIRFYSIPLSAISHARILTWDEAWSPDFTTLRFGNRLFGTFLELRKKSGVFRRILITPDDPEAFLRDLERNAR
jgi:hypothetical protein